MVISDYFKSRETVAKNDSKSEKIKKLEKKKNVMGPRKKYQNIRTFSLDYELAAQKKKKKPQHSVKISAK